MAQCDESLKRRLIPGALAATILLVVVVMTLGALLMTTGSLDFTALTDPYIYRVVRFSFWQATLSTVFSILLALPVARAFVRRGAFFGRDWLFKLLGLPLVIPVIVAVFGIVAIYGQNGLINRIAIALGFSAQQYLYGLVGIIIAHVFFNLPLAVRLLVPAWQSIAGESWRLATQLNMSSWHILRHIEWPLLRRVIPQIAGLVFMLCFTSFAVVLTLGGGPASSTIEVSVYQSLRFEFDLPQAAMLALLQLFFCIPIVMALQKLGGTPAVNHDNKITIQRPDSGQLLSRYGDYGWLLLILTSTLLPLSAVVIAGIRGPFLQVLLDTTLWNSVMLSLMIGISSSLIAIITSVAIVLSSRELRINWHRHKLADFLELSGSLILVVPPLVLGVGAFILLHNAINVFSWTPLLVIVVNAMMGIPYALCLLIPPLTRITQRHDRLCSSLGLRGWARLRLVEWPLVRYPLGLSLALVAAMSIGDLGVIALFGSQEFTTLPLLLYQRLSSYQLSEAAVTAVLLLALCLFLFVSIERLIGGKSRA